MSGWITDPQWWLSSIVAASLPWIFLKGRNWLTSRLRKTRGRLKVYFRNGRSHQLRLIKNIRLDSALINREIILSYTCLGLFVTSGMIYILGMVTIPILIQPTNHQIMSWGLIAGIPTLILEFCRLGMSSRVDLILKYRKKIKLYNRRVY